MKKETIYKLKLIKKYATIRFKRFWKEWGVSLEDCGIIFFCFLLFVLTQLITVIALIF